ncbi:hypothetical protein [Campylobacter suis]|nr:hypothetical protein [Campylobacter suis]
MLNFKAQTVVGIVLAVLGGVVFIYIKSLQASISKLDEKLKDTQTQLIVQTAQTELKDANLNECNAKISLQNKAINSLSIEKSKLEKINKDIKRKYANMHIPSDSSDCQTRLDFYESLFKGVSNE